MNEEEQPLVHVVDDDELVRDSLEWLLQSIHLPARLYADGLAFLEAYRPGGLGCVVLDVRMPQINGMELQQRLRERDPRIPVIIVTGHGDVPMATRAMKAGAYDFIEKPYNDHEVLARIQAAIAHHRGLRAAEARREAQRRPFATLTPREREVLHAVLQGEPNKGIAGQLGISVKTVELHRTNLMSKLGVKSATELVRLAIEAGMDRD